MDTVVTCGYTLQQECYIPEKDGGNRNYLIRLQTHGECGARLNNGEFFSLQKGDLLTLAPGDRLLLKKEKNASGASGDYYLSCRGEWIGEWYEELGRPKLTRVPPDESLLGLWRALIRDSRRVRDREDEEYLEALLRVFCLSVKRLLRQSHWGETEFIVSRMRRYIEDHAAEKLRVAQVAAQVSLSESRALHLFRETTGSSMVEYLTEVRLNLAVEQMRYSDSPLEVIAENAGFGSYSYFHRRFKRAFGVSPGQFRRDDKGIGNWFESTKTENSFFKL